MVLAACDPANPFGAALPSPDRTGADDADGPDGAGGAGALTPAGGTTTGGTATGGTKTGRGHQPARKAGALVVAVDGGAGPLRRTRRQVAATWPVGPDALQRAADALALAVREGALGRLTVERTDGSELLGSGHPVAEALARAGYHATPRGLRLRR